MCTPSIRLHRCEGEQNPLPRLFTKYKLRQIIGVLVCCPFGVIILKKLSTNTAPRDGIVLGDLEFAGHMGTPL